MMMMMMMQFSSPKLSCRRQTRSTREDTTPEEEDAWRSRSRRPNGAPEGERSTAPSRRGDPQGGRRTTFASSRRNRGRTDGELPRAASSPSATPNALASPSAPPALRYAEKDRSSTCSFADRVATCALDAFRHHAAVNSFASATSCAKWSSAAQSRCVREPCT